MGLAILIGFNIISSGGGGRNKAPPPLPPPPKDNCMLQAVKDWSLQKTLCKQGRQCLGPPLSYKTSWSSQTLEMSDLLKSWDNGFKTCTHMHTHNKTERGTCNIGGLVQWLRTSELWTPLQSGHCLLSRLRRKVYKKVTSEKRTSL